MSDWSLIINELSVLTSFTDDSLENNTRINKDTFVPEDSVDARAVRASFEAGAAAPADGRCSFTSTAGNPNGGSSVVQW